MDTYTIPEAAEITGLAPREVRVALENGRLRAVRTGGRWRIPRYELERAGMIAEGGPAEADGPAEPATEPAAEVMPLAPRATEDVDEVPASDEEIGGLHERLSDLERRVEGLEAIAERSSREASMREALAPLFSELHRPESEGEGEPGAPRFRMPR
jgi:excisionase family DNA binding protein